MFTDLRKKSGSLIVYLMFAAIIVTFVISFGPGDQGCQAQPNWVVTVSGDTITQAEFRFVYNNYYDFYQRMIPDFNAQKAKEMNIAKMALDGLVDGMLLAQKARLLGFVVTDEEIRTEILGTPYFQKDGAFDRDQYNRFVQFQMGMTVASYEEKIRRDLLTGKIRRFLTDSADISEAELKEDFVGKNETIDARFIIFSPAAMRPEAVERIKKAITEDELNAFIAKEQKRIIAFYDDHKERWVTEDKKAKPIEEVRPEIARDMILNDRLATLVKAEAAKAQTLLAGGEIKLDGLAPQFTDWTLAVKEQTGIKKNAHYLSDIGISPTLVTQLFTKSAELGHLAAPVTVDDKQVIAEVTRHSPADMVKFESEKENIRRDLQTKKARNLLEDYLKSLREQNPVEINQHWLAAFQQGGGDR